MPGIGTELLAWVPVGATEHLASIPVGTTEHIQVDFKNGMWWEMPPELSQTLLRAYHSGHSQVSFVWNWGGTRPGSHRINGQPTDYNRYVINFETMMQVNTDNNRTRKVQIVHKERS